MFQDYVAIVGQAHHEWPEAQDPIYCMFHFCQDDAWKQQLAAMTLYKTLEMMDDIVPVGYTTPYPSEVKMDEATDQ